MTVWEKGHYIPELQNPIRPSHRVEWKENVTGKHKMYLVAFFFGKMFFLNLNYQPTIVANSPCCLLVFCLSGQLSPKQKLLQQKGLPILFLVCNLHLPRPALLDNQCA